MLKVFLLCWVSKTYVKKIVGHKLLPKPRLIHGTVEVSAQRQEPQQVHHRHCQRSTAAGSLSLAETAGIIQGTSPTSPSSNSPSLRFRRQSKRRRSFEI